jgi:deoxyadenosine/deoxycytidine kinase
MHHVTLPLVVNAAEVDRLRVRMERRFRDLEIAESRGMPKHVLDRMFDAYMLAFREYDAALERLHQHR